MSISSSSVGWQTAKSALHPHYYLCDSFLRLHSLATFYSKAGKHDAPCNEHKWKDDGFGFILKKSVPLFSCFINFFNIWNNHLSMLKLSDFRVIWGLGICRGNFWETEKSTTTVFLIYSSPAGGHSPAEKKFFIRRVKLLIAALLVNLVTTTWKAAMHLLHCSGHAYLLWHYTKLRVMTNRRMSEDQTMWLWFK